MRTSTRRAGVSRAALAVGLAVRIAWLAMFTVVHGGLSLVQAVGGFVALAVAGWLWGADSRDGSSWRPREPGAWR